MLNQLVLHVRLGSFVIQLEMLMICNIVLKEVTVQRELKFH